MTEKIRVELRRFFKKRSGRRPLVLPGPWRSDVKDSTLSRRLSEFLGVALFAAALIWLISLVTHEPTDPVWFFTTGARKRAGELRRAASARSSPSCPFSCSATRRI